jgi:hypothetical protein
MPATYRVEVGSTDPLVIDGIVVTAGQATSVRYAGR